MRTRFASDWARVELQKAGIRSDVDSGQAAVGLNSYVTDAETCLVLAILKNAGSPPEWLDLVEVASGPRTET
jgi:hypothetical protein